MKWKIFLEFKLQDMWVGAYWQKSFERDLDIWICLIPCFPIHIMYYEPQLD